MKGLKSMKKYVLSVSGMSCAMCENHINDAIRRTCEIKSVKSDRRKNETVILAERIEPDRVVAELHKLGYEANLISETAYEKQSLFNLFRR